MNTRLMSLILMGLLLHSFMSAQVNTTIIKPEEFPSLIETSLLNDLSKLPIVKVRDISDTERNILKQEDESSQGPYRFACIIPAKILLPDDAIRLNTPKHKFWA